MSTHDDEFPVAIPSDSAWQPPSAMLREPRDELDRQLDKLAVSIRARTLPANICAYPLAGWRLDEVKFKERTGEPDAWAVALKRERSLSRPLCEYIVVARSDVGPLDAWDEALRMALRSDERARERAEVEP